MASSSGADQTHVKLHSRDLGLSAPSLGSAPLASATLALTARVATLSVDYAEETMKQAGESEVGPVRGHQGCLCV